jgi:carboxyl-terminal processing protease
MDAAKGSISGIGISVKEDTDTGYIKIIEVMDDTFASGTLKVGDLIVEVDGQDVLTFATETTSTYSEALRQIRVRLYDGVELTVRRNNTDEKFLFTNRVVDDTNLLTGEVISGNIGYIKLNRFEGGIAISLPSILKNLGDVKGYVIDIRNNSGGYISEAESFADCFLGEGDYAQANYRDGHSEIIIHGNTSSEDMIDKPIIILVNGHTASSAELFASVMKDYRDAKLVGVKTFGKGIMQEHFNPDGGGSLQLTVATIHSLKSSSYHGLGLLPDYEISLPSDLGIAVDPGVTEEDTQLQKAIELLS